MDELVDYENPYLTRLMTLQMEEWKEQMPSSERYAGEWLAWWVPSDEELARPQ